MDKPTIQVGSKKIEIWPEGQSLVVKVDPTIRATRFDDIDEYHPGLIAQILAMERQGEGGQDAKIITQDSILTRVESRLRSVGLKPVVEPGIAALGVQITASELKSDVWLA